ncbi:PadR family transcriptional regulator [Pseudonocardia sp. GCM10023141]|uniref:PadR family transcriptional regulator n=1 Tax=Pseudonocardia sp. GCM10023141 TaxID=3252653 RepID=UPI00361A720A
MVAVSLTPLAVSALALLCEQPMHPYEIYRLLILRRQDEMIKVRPGSLYHTIDRLAGAELVKAVSTDREGARPERTTYEVTVAGRETLQRWISAELACPVPEYPRFPVALSEAHNLSRAEAVEQLRARIRVLESELAETEGHLDHALTKTVEAHLLAVQFTVEIRTAELGWLRRLVNRLETEELAWPLDN